MSSTLMMGRSEEGGGDEEFLHALYQGGELLASGKVIEAKEHLEKAHALQPKHEKAQNLLGLTYFKLGLFDRASEIYELLVRENPIDPTLRINLGLVYLKTNALQRAAREFETATDLAPEHKKAHNYLGLALAQLGEFGRAREHFIQAGSEPMAEKMTRAIAGEEVIAPPRPKPAHEQQGFAELEGREVVEEQGGEQISEQARGEPPPPARAADPVPGAGPEAESDFGSVDTGSNFAPAPDSTPASAPGPQQQRPEDSGSFHIEVMSEAGPPAGPEAEEQYRPREPWGTRAGEEPPSEEIALTEDEASRSGPRSQAELEAAAGAGGEEAEAGGWEASGAAGEYAAPAPAGTDTPMAELLPALLLFHEPLPAPFTLPAEGFAAIALSGEMLLRLAGVVAVTGQIDFKPEVRRFRGRPSDRPFGEGAYRLVRATGQGSVVVGTGQSVFASLELGDESAYFREEVVFAFEEALSYENGRVPAGSGGDLELVHLRGTGQVLLRAPGPLRALQVTMERPVSVPAANLVGWHGNITPKVLGGLTEEGAGGQGPGPFVELSGEGFALFAVPLE